MGGETAQRGEAGVEQVLGRRGPGEHRLEHQEQHGQQDQDPEHRVQQHPVQAPGPGVRPRGRPHAGLQDGLGLTMGGADLRRARRTPVGGRGGLQVRQELVDLVEQLGQAALAHRHGGHHRHAELLRQPLQIDGQAAPLGDIDHVQGQHDRTAHLLQLQHQAQHEPEVGGVGDADQHVRRDLSCKTAQHHVTGDLLVRAPGPEAVGARQVDDQDPAVGGGVKHPLLALDGHARIVGHLLARPGQGVEQGGLAGVGVADQRHPRRGGGHVSHSRRRSCAA